MNTVKGLVALIDDDEAARVSIRQMLVLRGYKVEAFSSAEAALAWPGLADAGTIVTDVKMPGMDGEAFLGEVKRHGLTVPVIMITGYGDVAMAVRCLKSDAYDFIEKPFEDEVLIASVARAVEKTELRRETDQLRRRIALLAPADDGRFGMVGRSRVMQDLYEQIETYARTNACVLVNGETGSGKELVARAIHAESGRAKGPFVPVNAGAMPENMIESELFGHTRGAFTGADRDRDGKIVTATGGTLMLDEIESLSEPAQVKLLRVLEDGVVYPVGRDTPVRTDVRIIVTAKENLRDEVARGRMRGDFYHRVAVLTITIPSLRERTEDIPLLVSRFLKEAAERNGMPVPEIPEKTLGDMLRFQWPGNIRELKNAVERMVITSHGGITGPFEIDDRFTTGRLLSLPATGGRLSEALERTEQTVIETALKDNNGEVTAASLVLGISRRALYERMKKYGVKKEEYKP
ncbi:MAG: sigma-54 dependent transcriptional regulator [Planctomycetota bacterium]